jgi:hypothetical protein
MLSQEKQSVPKRAGSARSSRSRKPNVDALYKGIPSAQDCEASKFGKYVLKEEQFLKKHQLETRISKLRNEDEKARKRMDDI